MALLSVFVPLLIAFFKKTTNSQVANAITAVIVYAFAGIAAVIGQGLGGSIDTSNPASIANALVAAITIFATGGTVAYNLFWQHWGDPHITARSRG